MSDFREMVIQQQIAWRRAWLSEVKGMVVRNGEPYPHILPPEEWERNLWPGIRSKSAHSWTQYIAGKIQHHTDKNHLNSSWVLCANLYFPFRRSQQDMGILAAFLREHVAPEIGIVKGIELEFEGEGDLHPSRLL